jgi:hypothetical protein
VQGSFDEIPLITNEERDTIFAIARSFDQMPVQASPEEKTTKKQQTENGLSPFDDYNERGDVPALLEQEGWRFVYKRGDRIHYRRPGTTDSATSANFHTGLRVFYVFSTSTEFESGRGYNPVHVYTQLKHRGDYSAASKALYAEGYGLRRNGQSPRQAYVIDQTDTEESEPIPLPEKISPAPELSESLLPDEWREWLTDIADRMQCPLDFPTVAAIVGAASLIGNKIRIRPKKFDTWQVTANLWGAAVGLPSLLKSPAVNEGMFFFREIERKERAAYEAKLKDAIFDREFAEAKQAELKKSMRGKDANKEALRSLYQDLEVEEPKEKRLSTSDATVEKLGELLNEMKTGFCKSETN